MTPTGRRDVGPTTDRFAVLQLARAVVGVAIPIVAVLTAAFDTWLVVLAAAYVSVVGFVEIARRNTPRLGPMVVSSVIFVDGIILAVAVARTGGSRSPLLFLVFLLVVASTLLLSYRTGLKLAAWCALLLLFAHAAADSGFVDIDPQVSDRYAVVSSATFLLFALAAAAFSAVEERALRYSRAQLQWLVELGTELERTHDTEEIMWVLARHVCSRLGFLRVVVFTIDGDRWRGALDDGVASTIVETDVRPLVSSEDLVAGSPLLLPSLEDPLLDRVLPDARNVVVAPVVIEDEHLGIVAAEWGGDDRARIPLLTVHGLAEAAMHTAAALHGAVLLREVERLATRDSLTGIANRRLFDESLQREAARALRVAQPLSLVVLDVDHFKQINDTRGHAAGDRVLCEVAQAMVSSAKSYDVAARYGGDEFMLLLPGCGRSDAIGVAERVRAAIGRCVETASITVTAGVATLPDNAHDPDRLVAAADAALYEAKRAGRDRVVASRREAPDLPAVVRLGDSSLAQGA